MSSAPASSGLGSCGDLLLGKIFTRGAWLGPGAKATAQPPLKGLADVGAGRGSLTVMLDWGNAKEKASLGGVGGVHGWESEYRGDLLETVPSIHYGGFTKNVREVAKEVGMGNHLLQPGCGRLKRAKSLHPSNSATAR